MTDAEIIASIDTAVAEEHQLRSQHATDGLSASDRSRLQELEVHLDQLWDLLRQRRARREAGQDEAAAAPRPAAVVENYRS